MRLIEDTAPTYSWTISNCVGTLFDVSTTPSLTFGTTSSSDFTISPDLQADAGNFSYSMVATLVNGYGTAALSFDLEVVPNYPPYIEVPADFEVLAYVDTTVDILDKEGNTPTSITFTSSPGNWVIPLASAIKISA